MHEKPLVSVILPSFNHRQFVGEAIYSVLNQTYPHIQLIVIDDGSTDGSAELIADLAKKHDFEYVSQANAGLIDTLNLAKTMVRGKYVSLAASDDFYHHCKIERLVNYLELHPGYAMVHSKIVHVDEGSREICRIDEQCGSGQVFGSLLRGDFHINGLSALVRSDVYSKFQYGQFYIDDLYMWLCIAEKYPVGYVDEYFAYYRRHDNHLSGNAEKMMASEKAILDCFSHAPEYKEAVFCWGEKWFKHYVSQQGSGGIRQAYKLGRELLVQRRWSFSVVKSWLRLLGSSTRLMISRSIK